MGHMSYRLDTLQVRFILSLGFGCPLGEDFLYSQIARGGRVSLMKEQTPLREAGKGLCHLVVSDGL